MQDRFFELPEYHWYQCTVDAPLGEILDVLGECFPQEAPAVAGGGVNGYTHSFRQTDAYGEQVWMLMYGGTNPSPNICANGDYASEWRQSALDHFPDHSVTRLDTAIDTVEPGFFDRVLPTVVDLGRQSGVELQSAGVWLASPTSRTQYAGSRKSARRFRMYEKGAEYRRKHKTEEVDLNWVRCEMQFRPNDKRAKVRLAKATHAELWGVSRLSRAIYHAMIDENALRGKLVLPQRATSQERAWAHAMVQYGSVLRAHLDVWGPERFIDEIRSTSAGHRYSKERI